jgi:tripartite ATP-independent transporter DctM subunit
VLIGSVLAVLYACVLAWREPRRPLLMGLGSLVVLVVLLSIARPAWQPVIQSLGTVGPVFALLFVAVLAGVPVTYALGLSTVAGVWLDGRVGLAALPNRVEAGADQFVLLAIPFFVLAGTLMESGGISVRLVDFVRVLLGHVRGGLGIVMIGSMYLFSGVSGSKAADMAAVGSVLIPTMKRRDYDEGEGVAILAASAVMGETIPPSIAILVLASVTSLSVSALFIGGVIPAIALGLILAAAVYVRAGRLGGVRDPRPTAGQALRSFGGALLPLGMPVIIFGGILLGVATPTEVSSFAVLFGLLVSVLVYREMGLARVMAILVEAASVGGMIMFIASTGSALSWVLTLQGVPQRIATWMTDAHVGAVGFLVMTIVLMAFMGAVLEGVPALLVFAPMLLPAATELGVHPLHFGIVLIIAMGIGLFAPPVGAGLYIAAAIGRVLPERAMRPMLVYLTVLTLGVVLVAAVPELTLWLPRTVGALK